MTENLLENLLPKLEEKMMVLLTELEDARLEIRRLSHENSMLRVDRENHSKKLIDLLSLLDTVSGSDQNNLVLNMSTANSNSTLKPVLVQDNLVQDKISTG